MREDGGPAFPDPGRAQSGKARLDLPDTGMSLRDYFAASAMAAIISKNPCDADNTPDDRPLVTVFHLELVRGAYAYADAMLVERNK
jgi:hypothetical protein